MNDLRTLIDLCPGIRLPQNEEEIFSGKKLTKYYLRKLCGQYEWYFHEHSAPSMAYRYARRVMESTWPEAEAVIASDPEYAYYYARYMIKSRWSEAEAVIASDPEYAYYYARVVVKSRWPEAEPVISTADLYRKWYNDEFGTKI